MQRLPLERLERTGVLGQGARGEVVSVVDRVTGLRYAQKPFDPARREELAWLSRLRHPNLVSIDAFVSGGEADTLLVRLAEAGTLSEAVASGRDPMPLLADALRALAFLHARGVVHGDVKPANLLVGDEGLRLSDLDLARPIGAPEAGGTLAFMAPERQRGAPSSPAGDLYGLGASFAVALGAPIDADARRDWLRASSLPIAPTLLEWVDPDPVRRPPSVRKAARALAVTETNAAARAYLRARAPLGLSAVIDDVLRVSNAPGLLRIRAAPGCGATTLLAELGLRCGVVPFDPRDVDAPLLSASGTVLLDDADDGGESLQALLVAAQRRARAGEPAAFTVCVTRPGSALDRALEGEGAGAVSVELLSVDSVRSIAADAWPDRGDPSALARRLHELTGGHPGRLFSVLERLSERSEPGALSPGDVPGPESVDDAPPQASIDVPGELEPLAALLVCARRPLEPGLVARLLECSEAGLRRLRAALDDLRWLRAGPSLAIAGEALRSLISDALPDRVRVAAHRSLYESISPASSDPRTLADRLHHALGAGLAVPDASAAARTLCEASLPHEWIEVAQALERHRPIEPSERRWLAQALIATGSLEHAQRVANALGEPLLSADLHLRAGRYPEAISALESLAERDAAAEALLARALALSGRRDEAIEVCERALAKGARGPAQLDLEATRALASYYAGDLEAARTGWGAAAALARANGDASRQASAVNGLGLVAQRRAQFDEARAHYASALELAQRCGDRAREGTSHLNLGTVLQELGRTREAAQHYRRSATVAALTGDRAQEARATSNLANLLLVVGRCSEALEPARRAREAARICGAGVVEAYATLLEGEAGLWLDRVGAAGLLATARERFDALGSASEALEAALLEARALGHDQGPRAAREVAAKAARAGLARHELHAWLLVAEFETDGVRGLAAAHRALGLALEELRPDLSWRAEAMLALRTVDAPEASRRAAAALARLEEAASQVDEEDRTTWLARPDRQALRARLHEVSRRSPAGASSSDARWTRLLAINRRLGAEQKPGPLLENIVDHAVELCGAERGFVLLAPESAEGPLQVAVARNIDGESLAKGALKVSHGIAERVVREGEPELTLDAQEDERYQAQLSVAALKLRSVVCVPLRWKGRVLGALYIDNRFRARAFGPDDLSLLEAFADQAAIALGQVRALEAARQARDEADRARAEIEALNRRLSDEVVQQQAQLQRARREADEQRFSLAEDPFHELVGRSAPMRRLKRQLERVAATELTVLVTGESGTGKELVARAIFAHGARRDRPFVSLNCAALSEGLLESELFGHVRGAFTGADRDRDGLFQVAHTGTLFLDEVGDMGLAMQAKLLRALQEGEIRKVGGKEPIHVDVRVVAATNRDLRKLVAEGRFREDLFYRLHVVGLELPSLRERLDDLPLLCARLLEHVPCHAGPPRKLAPDALALLSRHAWPGNVRELAATLHNAALFADGEWLGAADFPMLREPARPQNLGPGTIEELELEAIRRMLEATGGNKSETARRLGIDRKTLYNKLERLRIERM